MKGEPAGSCSSDSSPWSSRSKRPAHSWHQAEWALATGSLEGLWAHSPTKGPLYGQIGQTKVSRQVALRWCKRKNRQCECLAVDLTRRNCSWKPPDCRRPLSGLSGRHFRPRSSSIAPDRLCSDPSDVAQHTVHSG